MSLSPPERPGDTYVLDVEAPWALGHLIVWPNHWLELLVLDVKSGAEVVVHTLCAESTPALEAAVGEFVAAVLSAEPPAVGG